MKTRRIFLMTVLLLAGLWGATQYAAHRLGYDPQLGGRLYRGWDGAVYAPWSVLVWSMADFRGGREAAAIEQAMAGFMVYAIGLVGITAMATRYAAPSVKAFGTRGWGTRREMKQAGLLGDAGTVVGAIDPRPRSALLTYDGPEHQLVSGASRSGKGVGHVVPTLLCWPDSVLVYDVKNELWELTAGFRGRSQHCLFFNPTKLDSARFNPLLEVRKGPNEVRDIQNIVEILINPDGAKKTLNVWDQNTFQFLTALILHVLYTASPGNAPESASGNSPGSQDTSESQNDPGSRKTLGYVRELLLDFDATCEAMMTTPHRLHPQTHEPEVYPEVSRVARSLLSQAERFRSSVRGTAEGYLTLWADEIVCEVTSRSDFTIGDLVCLDKPVTLYLQPPPSDADRVRPLIRLMLNQVARALMENPAHDSRGRVKRHRLLLLLDEFPTLGRLPFFSENMRQMAGYGLKAHLIVQSFNDIIEHYGMNNTIIDNCHVLCCFASADTLTQQRISQMTGEVVEYRDSYSRPRSILSGGHRSISQSEHVRPLLQPGEVRTFPFDDQIVFVTGFKPFRTKKLRYYTHPTLRQRILDPPDQSQGVRLGGGPTDTSGVPAAVLPAEWDGERAKGDPIPLPEDLRVPRDEASVKSPVAAPVFHDNNDQPSHTGDFF